MTPADAWTRCTMCGGPGCPREMPPGIWVDVLCAPCERWGRIAWAEGVLKMLITGHQVSDEP